MILLEYKLGPEVFLIPLTILFLFIVGIIHFLVRTISEKMSPTESAIGMFVYGFSSFWVADYFAPIPHSSDHMSPLTLFFIYSFALKSIFYFIFFIRSVVLK